MYPNAEELYNPLLARPMHAEGMYARGLTQEEACLSAKQQLCALGWNLCATATCQDVVNKICSDCSIFTGQDINRLTLTGSYNCPISPCPSTSPPPGGDMTTILLIGAGLAAAVVIGLAVAGNTKKMVLVARPQAPHRGG